MSSKNPKITTPWQLAILKALVKKGELSASEVPGIVHLAILKVVTETGVLPSSKTENPTGIPTDEIMGQLAANGWKFSYEQVPELGTNTPLSFKPIYRLDLVHRELAAKMINKRDERRKKA